MSSSAHDLRSRSYSARGAIALVAALLLMLGTRLHASVIPLTMEELTALAEEIHAVEVIGTETYVYEGIIVTRAKLQVLESFRGTMTGQAEIDYYGGRYENIGLMPLPGTDLKTGDLAVLFLSNPLANLTPAERSQYNQESPLVRSPQLVGAAQGRFELRTPRAIAETAQSSGDRTSVLPTSVVTRTSQGTVRHPSGRPPMVSYPQFAAELHRLVAETATLPARGAQTRSITGIAGEFHIAERDNSRAIRRLFDPLPPIAYSTPEQYEAIIERLEIEQAERELAIIRGEIAPPAVAPEEPKNEELLSEEEGK